MSYTIIVDRVGCIACAACYSTDPQHFEGDSDGKSLLIDGTVNGYSERVFNDGLRDDAQRAADSCPVSVITVK